MLSILACICSFINSDQVPQMTWEQQIEVYEYIENYIWDNMSDKDRSDLLYDMYKEIMKKHSPPRFNPKSGY